VTSHAVAAGAANDAHYVTSLRHLVVSLIVSHVLAYCRLQNREPTSDGQTSQERAKRTTEQF